MPLVNFHYDVKAIAQDAVYAVQSVDAVKELEFMDGYFDMISGRLRG
ncbi:MAG: hypothetical protein AB8B88_06325 [Devosiaceae bacterium]